MTSRSILLVEDNRQDEILTIRALRRGGFDGRVDVARDGQQALDFLLREGEFADWKDQALPAVVLLDLNLPRVGGHDVLVRLRAEPATRTLPIVVLTTSDDERDASRSHANGADAYVRKLIDFARFAADLSQAVARWLLPGLPPRG